MAFLTLAAAALIPATAFVGLARLIPASALLTMSAVILAFISAAACGIAMMIRIEQLDPDSGHSNRSDPGNSGTSDALDTDTPRLSLAPAKQ